MIDIQGIVIVMDNERYIVVSVLVMLITGIRAPVNSTYHIAVSLCHHRESLIRKYRHI